VLGDWAGGATGIPIERTNSADAGGSAAFRRAPVSRMRDSNSTPAASAFVIPEISTTSAFAPRIDRAAVQACSNSRTLSSVSSPSSTNRNIVALSCCNIFICVYRRMGFFCSALKKLDQLPSQRIHICMAINRHTGVTVSSEPSDDFNDLCVSQHYKQQAMRVPAFLLAVQTIAVLCEHQDERVNKFGIRRRRRRKQCASLCVAPGTV
jgi:hypothetical protein